MGKPTNAGSRLLHSARQAAAIARDPQGTALAAAFARAGLDEADAAFDVAIARYLNQGGSIARAHARLDAAADKMGGAGHRDSADKAMTPPFGPSQPDESEGHAARIDKTTQAMPALSPERSGGQEDNAEKAVRKAPSAAPPRDGAGRELRADKAKQGLPRPVSPAYLTAAKQGAKDLVATLGWLGEATIPGGPKFASLRWRDIDGMVERQISEGATHARAAIALGMIRREGERLGRVDPEALWTDTLPAETVRAISQATEAEILKPMAVGWLRGLSNSVQEITDAR